MQFNPKYNEKEIGGLQTVCIEGDSQGSHIILLHGYGADAYDLASLSAVLAPNNKPKPNWYFPQGILNIDIGYGNGKAWFPIDMQAIQYTKARDYANIVPKGVDVARSKIIHFINALNQDYNKIILGGFSQGAMISTDVMLHLEEKIQGLLILSGTLVCQDIWKSLADKKIGQSFFQSHGQFDPLLDIESATTLNQILNRAGLKGNLYVFPGSHEIPFTIVEKAQEYLSNIL